MEYVDRYAWTEWSPTPVLKWENGVLVQEFARCRWREDGESEWLETETRFLEVPGK